MQHLFLRNCLQRSCYKRCGALSYSNSKQIESSVQKYTPIYSYPQVQIFALINRIKLYQTGITIVGIPVSCIAASLDILSTEYVLYVSAIGVTGCVTLYGLGQLCNKFIGFIYVNEDISTVKVSYADFWGRRKDVEVSVKDIVPFSDIPPSITDRLYQKVIIPSLSSSLKMNVNNCKILDRSKFNQVFPFTFIGET